MTQKIGGRTQKEIITLTDLSKAIMNRLRVDKKEARRIAGFILDIFGYEDRVIDNILDLEGRQLFYILEEEGMITSGREETTLYNGREWLTHYWQLKRNTIIRFSKNGKKRASNSSMHNSQSLQVTDAKNIYNSLSKDMWNARNINKKKQVCYFLMQKFFS